MDLFESKYTAEDLENAVKAVLAPFEEGRKAERDYFWENFSPGNDWSCAFSGNGWNDTTFNPTKNLVTGTNVNSMFQTNNVHNLKQILQRNGVVLDTSAATSNYNFARNANVFYWPHIDFRKCSVLDNSFAGAVQTRELTLSVKEKVKCSNVFQNCRSLTELTILNGTFGTSISFGDSPLLNDASRQSIINALADLTGATTQNVTFHADVGGKLTATQKAAITAKNWTLVY